jgi:PhzF family phenazine biosynthesis protein
MDVEVNIINSFSIKGTGGNPAAVVLDADALSNGEKQSIATKIGLSETAFVSSSQVADFKLDFFTPNKQIAHCGHATIATFSYLKSIGRISENQSSKETIDGVREILYVDGEAYMQQTSPTYYTIPDPTAVLNSLGIEGRHLNRDFPISVVNTGNSMLLVGLSDEDLLPTLRPDMARIATITCELNCIGYYVFALSAQGVDAQTRMFAPFYGIEEESATGMGAGPLGCVLHGINKDKTTFRIGQGKYMQPPSESLLKVSVQANSAGVKSLMAGGGAYLDRQFSLKI